MKVHLVFCCCPKCAEKEMSDIVIKSNGNAKINKSRREVVVGEKDRYVFFVDINRTPERIKGYFVDSYRTCSEYSVRDEIAQYLDIRMRVDRAIKNGI